LDCVCCQVTSSRSERKIRACSGSNDGAGDLYEG
jgi:hypothetical protein